MWFKAFSWSLAGLLMLGLCALATAQEPVQLAMLVQPAENLDEELLPSSQEWTDSHCSNCHEMEALFSHRVDIAPTLAVPPDFPLEDGQITCLTCHESSLEAHAQARINHTKLLRGSLEGKAFCANCHNSGQSGRVDAHGSSIGRAHLPRTERNEATAAAFGASGTDEESRNCLSCHDGNISTEAGTGAEPAIDGLLKGDHPIGVAYRNSMHPTPGGGSMTPPARLDHRIRLTDGQVTCISCHSPYSQEADLLVMSNEGSNLCLSCHDGQ